MFSRRDGAGTATRSLSADRILARWLSYFGNCAAINGEGQRDCVVSNDRLIPSQEPTLCRSTHAPDDPTGTEPSGSDSDAVTRIEPQHRTDFSRSRALSRRGLYGLEGVSPPLLRWADIVRKSY